AGRHDQPARQMVPAASAAHGVPVFPPARGRPAGRRVLPIPVLPLAVRGAVGCGDGHQIPPAFERPMGLSCFTIHADCVELVSKLYESGAKPAFPPFFADKLLSKNGRSPASGFWGVSETSSALSASMNQPCLLRLCRVS